MYLLFLFFWAIAFFIIVNEFHTTSDTWVAAAIFFFGFGGLSAFLQDFSIINQDLWFIPATAASISMIWGPYALLMHALHYAGKMPHGRSMQRVVEFISALPLAAFYFVIPAMQMFGLREPSALQSFHTIVMTAFVTPYFVGSAILLTINLFHRDTSVRRSEAIISYVLIVPSTMMYYLTAFLIPCFGYADLWRVNIVTIIAESFLFLILVIRKNAFGLFLRQKNATREQVEKSIVEGTGVLQHALKNNLLTVRLSLQNAKYLYNVDRNDRAAVLKNIQLALDSCDHSLSILDRIHLKIHPVRLTLKKCTLIPIIEQVIDQSQTEFTYKKVQIIRRYNCNPLLLCDPVHIREVILNLVNNAMEAICENEAGQMIISVIEDKDKTVLQIIDNGCGMEKSQIKKLGIPLLTSKVEGTHYGLGLYYVKKVIGMHNGHFSLRSVANGGMIAEVVLPTVKDREKWRYENISDYE